MSRKPADPGYHAALASSTRRRILDVLGASAVPLNVAALAARVDLHVSTVRFHLNQLERARLIRRQIGPSQRRGRPRVLYVVTGASSDATSNDDATRADFVDVLVDAVGARPDGRAESEDAGRRWADSLDESSLDAAGLAQLLQRLGFAPEPDGDSAIRLHACPLRDAARKHPDIVCSVHRGLLERSVEGGGGSPRRTVNLVPFVEPEMCLVTLAVRDLQHPALQAEL